MKFIIGCIVFLSVSTVCLAQKKEAYVIYTKDGKRTTYEKMLKACLNKDLVMFGEQHNSAIAHWLQIELVKDLYLKRKLMLGAEMFESDNQEAINRYLAGAIKQKGLDTLVRLWPNYKTDYAPLLNFAKDSQLVFVATNVPRKIANLVFKRGFQVLDSLPDSIKKIIAPLPIVYDSSLKGYAEMLTMMDGHGGANLPKAQATKDATMAYHILKNWKQGELFIHFNGAYHSDNFEGIMWYIALQNKELRAISISTVVQKEVSNLEKDNYSKADYIICVDEDMTTTY